jgi:pimeloyl-ACP methyl ester carboxylesterase
MPTAETLNDPSWQRARMTWPYEPAPVLAKIRCPVLAVWGAEDDSFAPQVHRPLFERTMQAARHADYRHQVIPGADHSFHVVAPSFLELTGFVPDYFRTVIEWLKARNLTRARPDHERVAA